MKNQKNTSLLLFWLLLMVSVNGLAQDTTKDEHAAEKEAALKSVQVWLSLVDDSNYATSWDEAAALFQKNVTKDDWNKGLEGVRTPLGKMISREVAALTYLTQMPGAPDGEYVIIQFKTSFENKKEAVETITPMKEDGAWKVSGYFIR